MPELLHSSSPTRTTAARSGGSLLRAAGAAYAVNPQGAAGAYVNELCAGLFLAAVERDGLRHVRSAEVERQHETLGDLERFGRVALSWRTDSGEVAGVSTPPSGPPSRATTHRPSGRGSGGSRARRPGRGTVLLWHGAPGTGKTHALQALARAWRGWCALHYVTDPDAFLTGTDYLMSVATALPDEGEPAWRLIVLEDAGELMGASARVDTGQGLSRVLNLTDGLLGQGQRCLLLVTTNEPVGRLHPALRRPGRCWAEVEFAPFSAGEAAAWLRRRGAVQRAPAGGTLAELYALAEDRVLAEPPREAFGFGRAVSRS